MRQHLPVRADGGGHWSLAVERLETLQQREIDYWRDSEHEAPESDSLYNLVSKMFDVGVLMNLLHAYSEEIRRTGLKRALELGGGQGWASCVVKRLFNTHVTLTDISPFAIQSAGKWERVLNVTLDNKYDCLSYATSEESCSVDLVFCFASAHHFHAHRRTLIEMHRVLRQGGVGIYFFEPTCPRFLHRLAVRRANRIRPAVEEDVLIRKDIMRIAREVGLDGRIDFYPSVERRSTPARIYYALLAKMPSACAFLPCTANLVFRKPFGEEVRQLD